MTFYNDVNVTVFLLIRMFLGLSDTQPDPLVRGTGYGSEDLHPEFFHHQAKIVRKILSSKNDINVPVFRIRNRIQIRRIRMFLGLPDPDPLVIGTDPHPDPY
jgi:hypothetical protein